MKESPIAIKTEYLKYKEEKEKTKTLLKIMGVATLAGVTYQEWAPVANKVIAVGKEIVKILMSGN